MVEVKVGGLLPDPKNPGSHILLLKIPGIARYLPIWIGPAEASSINMALRNQVFERPLTHDLLQHVIHGLGAEVSRIVITTIEDSTFFARIFLERDQEVLSIDARPSDSVALAVRVKCPIFLTQSLLDSQREHLIEIQEGPAPSSPPAPMPEAEGSPTASSLEELMRQVERGEGGPPDDDDDEDEERKKEED
mgnify:CR=1 FL=1